MSHRTIELTNAGSRARLSVKSNTCGNTVIQHTLNGPPQHDEAKVTLFEANLDKEELYFLYNMLKDAWEHLYGRRV